MLFRRITILVLFTMLVVENLCVEMVLERCELVFTNASYFKELKFNVRKYSRNGKRYLNAYAVIVKTLDEHMMAAIGFEEYLHNEYRPTFINLKFNFCELLGSKYMQLNQRYGLPCPMPPMEYVIPNMTIYTESFPDSFPLQQGRIRIRVFIPKPPIEVASGYVYATFSKKSKH